MVSLMTTVPGSASPWRRAATLGADPMMAEPSMFPSGEPAITTVPEWTPTRMAGSMPWRRCSSTRGVGHPFDEPQSGQHRPPGVVPVGRRVAEARNDAVALELQDATVQLLDGLGRHPAVDGEDLLHDLGLGHLGHVGRLDDVGEDQADEGPLAFGQRALERGPFDHRCGALIRRVDGQDVVGELDHAVPAARGRGGVHRRQKPIDQQRQTVFRRSRRLLRGRRHLVVPQSPAGGDWAWLT